jgi:sarcosine oxidase delta subunit
MDYELFIPTPIPTSQIGCEACVCDDGVLCVCLYAVQCCVVRFDLTLISYNLLQSSDENVEYLNMEMSRVEYTRTVLLEGNQQGSTRGEEGWRGVKGCGARFREVEWKGVGSKIPSTAWAERESLRLYVTARCMVHGLSCSAGAGWSASSGDRTVKALALLSDSGHKLLCISTSLLRSA